MAELVVALAEVGRRAEARVGGQLIDPGVDADSEDLIGSGGSEIHDALLLSLGFAASRL